MNARDLLKELPDCVNTHTIRGVRLVLSFVEHNFANEKLGPVDELLKLVEPASLSTSASLALVRATYRCRDALLYYDYALEKVRQHLVNIGQKPKVLLYGLPYKQ